MKQAKEFKLELSRPSTSALPLRQRAVVVVPGLMLPSLTVTIAPSRPTSMRVSLQIGPLGTPLTTCSFGSFSKGGANEAGRQAPSRNRQGLTLFPEVKTRIQTNRS